MTVPSCSKGQPGDGLPEGDYRVRLEVGESNSSQGHSRRDNAVSEKYLDEDASDLTATVKPDESSNNFEFKLTPIRLDARHQSSQSGHMKA